ncbi:DUF1203 domain-containing protein [Microbulbifer echini]|uniref:DUF1203 domain-containing protein n=1 Tax=Microbulbifer echini TaxID=1529067 RepID=A0ABV4NIR2_9GAMM
MDFLIRALSAKKFHRLMSLSDSQLKRQNICWKYVDSSPGYPCRVSLQDALLGERVLCMPFAHLKAKNFYCASGPIFVRENAKEQSLNMNEIPTMLRHRQLSLRAYSSEDLMVMATICEGVELEGEINKLLCSAAVNYIHIHNAIPGCFNCAVYRV